MKARTIILGSFIFFTFLSCTINNNNNLSLPKNGPQNPKPGSCYAKCIIPDQFDTDESYIAVYTGDENIEDVDIEVIEITLKPASSKWEKKVSDRNCLSPDPNDCLVWCKVDIPAETKSYKILKDTSQSQNYVLEEIKRDVLTKKGGHTEWKEVICNNQFNNEMYIQIQNSLALNGFYKDEIVDKDNSEFRAKVKAALTAFQKANQLPVGQLDFETLDALGIDY